MFVGSHLYAEGENRVAYAACVFHSQIHEPYAIAAIPGVHRIVVAHGAAIHAAQEVVETVETACAECVVPVRELYIIQVVVTVELEHYIIPFVVEKLHVGEVNDVVHESINIVAIVVEVVQGIAIRSSPCQAEYATNGGIARVAAHVDGYNRTIYPNCAVTPRTNRRTDGVSPTPAIVAEIVEEAIAIVTRTPTAGVTIGRVVNLGTDASQYLACYLGTVCGTAAWTLYMALAVIVASGTYSASVVTGCAHCAAAVASGANIAAVAGNCSCCTSC